MSSSGPAFTYSPGNTNQLLLYDAEASPCARRVRITMIEKGLRWDSVWIDLSSLQQRRPDYLRINPNGFVPSFAHDGRVLYEANVITEYLDDVFPTRRLYPDDAEQRAEVKKWQSAELAMGKDYRTLMYTRMLGPIVRMTRSKEEALRIARRSTDSAWDLAWVERIWDLKILTQQEEREYEDRLFKWLDRLEIALHGKTYLVGGGFTQAEISVYPRVDMYAYIGLHITKQRYPNVHGWMRRLQERDSFTRSLTGADKDVRKLASTGLLLWAKNCLQRTQGPRWYQSLVIQAVGLVMRQVMGVGKLLRADWQPSDTAVPQPPQPLSLAPLPTRQQPQTRSGLQQPLVLWGNVLSPHTQRICMALRWYGWDYRLRVVDLTVMEHKSPSLTTLNPNGELPVLSCETLTLFETENIVDYLDAHALAQKRLIPDDPHLAAQARMWLALEQGTHKELRPLFYLHTIRPILQQRFNSRSAVGASVPPGVHPSYASWIMDVYDGRHRFDSNEDLAKQQIFAKLDRVNAHLQNVTYFVGSSLTFADLAWYSRVRSLGGCGIELSRTRFSNTIRWMDQLSSLPALDYA